MLHQSIAVPPVAARQAGGGQARCTTWSVVDHPWPFHLSFPCCCLTLAIHRRIGRPCSIHTDVHRTALLVQVLAVPVLRTRTAVRRSYPVVDLRAWDIPVGRMADSDGSVAVVARGPSTSRDPPRCSARRCCRRWVASCTFCTVEVEVEVGRLGAVALTLVAAVKTFLQV